MEIIDFYHFFIEIDGFSFISLILIGFPVNLSPWCQPNAALYCIRPAPPPQYKNVVGLKEKCFLTQSMPLKI